MRNEQPRPARIGPAREDYINNSMEDEMTFKPIPFSRRGAVIAALLLGVVAGLLVDGAASGSSVDVERNKEIALRWSKELWGQGKLPVADEIIAPDYERHDPGDPFPAHGPDDVKRIVTMVRSMLPDLRIEVEMMVAEGDFVVSRYTATATDTVGYMGMPPTGKTIRTPAIQIFRFANGKIVESWAARDDLGTLKQLGHWSPPQSQR
jgi:steroid delta-isomerase-like uncharacterized protein